MIDFDNIRLVVCQAIRMAVGNDLSQQPTQAGTQGTIIEARPPKEALIPDYPYAKVDLLQTRDDGFHLRGSCYSTDAGGIIYNTTVVMQYQVTILGENTLELSHKLKTAHRRSEIIELYSKAGIGILDAETVSSSPEFYDTDFLEQGVFILELRVPDVTVVDDEEYGSAIEIVQGDGEICHYKEDPNPLGVIIDVDTSNP